MKKLNLILILAFLVLASSVIAVPPFQSTDTTLLQVVVPKPEYMLLDNTFIFNVHVFDTNGLLLDNTTTTCKINVYNTTGDHIINETMLFSNYDFHYSITGSDYLTEKGLFPFVVWCYNSTNGGYYSGDLEINDVTSIGINEDSTQGMSISLFILFATLLIFFLPKLYGTFSKNKIVDLIIVRCCYVIGFYLMVMNAGLFASIAANAGYATGEVFRYMWLFGIGGYLMMFITGIKTLFDITELYNNLVKERRGLM